MLLAERQFGSTMTVSLAKKEGPLTIAVVPGDECTLKVELSLDNGRSYVAWVPGNVSVPTNATTVPGQTPTHVKLTRLEGAQNSWCVVSR